MTALVRDRLALFGLVVIALLVLAALLAPWLAPYPAQGAGAADVAARNLAPSGAHPLGTDGLGRDVLSRIVYGARPALYVPLLVVGLAVLIGVPLGLVAGYRGGRTGEVIMRVCDMFLAFPPLLLAMAIVALLGPSLANACLALAVSWWPWYTRLVQGLAASLRERPFVEGARALGLPDWVIMGRHILPNAASPILVQATVDIGTVVLAAASLAFLGLGTQPPAADWGLMISDGRVDIFAHWWISAFPGLAIFLTVLACNLVGDALRDIFDPRSAATAKRAARRSREPVAKPAKSAKPADALADAPIDAPVEITAKRTRDAPLLEIENLRVAIGDAVRVREVNLTVRPGEIVGIVGESGCGKTLTALSVIGMLPPGATAAGSIRLHGRTLLGGDLRRVRGREIAMIFQSPATSFDPVTTIGRQLRRVIRLRHGLSRAAALELADDTLKAVGLDAARVLGAYPHELSGGMLQRAMIAMALACRPDLVIADEPTVALDVTVAKEIRSLLRSLQAEYGFGVLYITHNLGEVRELCDRVHVLYAGEVVETGPVPEVLDRPAHPYTKALLAALPDAARAGDRLAAIPGAVPARPDTVEGCVFADRCDHAMEACRTAPVLRADPDAAGEDRASACHLKGVPA
ncbi:dipeptide/oligopeptide/nickel ABC transporter permease/ATP-binding protein [Spirillospora sp. NPDC048819]|uniref:dipeptide/oligopeptide/nickel ABC transporter permease/ATP-binding protein n=1 Tax=Spirillospora sp. NPDC048819 TaxID=3155268 RepID=UPI003411D254